MNLEELKAENARREAEEAGHTEAEAEVSPQEIEAEAEEAAKAEDVEPEEVAEPEEGETEAAEAEAWMQGDDQSSDAEKEKRFSGEDIGAAKAKVRAKANRKLEEKDSEIERLKQELEAATKSAPVQVSAKPTRDQFFEADDPDEAYAEALTDWKLDQRDAKRQAEQAQQATATQQKQAQLNTQIAVDQHYESAANLVKKHGISEENYQASDYRVRSMIDSVFNGSGDVIADQLIATVGKDSAQVMYNIGVNQQKLDGLKQSLTEDPSGFKAAVYLGKLSAELTAPQKRKSDAPKPAAQVKGDAKSVTTSAVLRKYKAAMDKGDSQAAYNIKKDAKAAGANTQDW